MESDSDVGWNDVGSQMDLGRDLAELQDLHLHDLLDHSDIEGLDDGGVVESVISVSPETHDFGVVEVGLQSSSATFVLTNTGSSTEPLFTLTGDTQDFVLIRNGCVNILQIGESCEFEVRFVPMSVGPKVFNMNIQAGQLNPIDVVLSGMANPMLPLRGGPGVLNFVAQVGTSQTARIENISSGAIGPLTTLMTGPDASSFPIEKNECEGVTLAAFETSEVDVGFAPTGAGPKEATLRITAPNATPRERELASTLHHASRSSRLSLVEIRLQGT